MEDKIVLLSAIFLTLISLVYTNNCNLATLPLQGNLDDTKMVHLWYEIRWYPAKQFDTSSAYEDYTYNISKKEGEVEKLYYTLSARKPGEDNCTVTDKIEANRLKESAYYFYDEIRKKMTYSYIIYMEYDQFMVEFLCYKNIGETCENPEVRFWSRERSARPEDIRKGEALLDKLCVDKNKFVNIRHHKSCFDGTVYTDKGCWLVSSMVVYMMIIFYFIL